MNATLSIFAPQPSAPGVAVGTRTGVLVSALLDMLRAAEPPIEVAEHWLETAPRDAGTLAGARRAADELRRLAHDRSRNLLLLYPQVPALIMIVGVRGSLS